MADKSQDKHWQRSIKIGFQKADQPRGLQKAKKQLKNNRQPKPARRKDWLADDFDELEHQERVMPKGERERRRQVLALAQTELEAESNPPLSAQLAGLTGVVLEVSSNLCRVDLAGQSLLCRLRGALSAQETGFTNVIAVGDRVIVQENSPGHGVVEQVLPRRSVLARPDVFRSHLRQVIVANADQLLIVAAWRNPLIWLELIDRYLIAAERHNLIPLICVNKVDLAADQAECQILLQPYQTLGYQVLFTSARTHSGLDLLREAMRGRVTALAGLSGVGKSSLLNAIQPGLHLRTGAISDGSGNGQHTTTQVSLLPLAMGGFVADTPGIREFGLSGLSQSELIAFYPDLTTYAHLCRFANCSHQHEPDCAVKAAVTAQKIAPIRYDNYLKIYHSLA